MAKSARVLGAAAIAVASVFMTLAPAGASSSARLTSRVGARATAVPNTDMAGKGATARFVPKTLTANVYSQTKCSKPTPPKSFTITNSTRNSYDITYNGSVIFTLPPKTIENLCVYGRPGKLTLGIDGSTHVLKVTLVKPAA
jgi:hypothetical protein